MHLRSLQFSVMLILLIGLTSVTFAKPESKDIRIYTWWDYVPGQVIDKLKTKKSKINIVEYRSNEVALSKLLSGSSDYDIAIVSNWVVRVLEDSGAIDTQILVPLIEKRKYLEFGTAFSKSCVPYLWSTTTFAADSKNVRTGPRTINELLALQNRSFSIGIVDDPIEFAARIVADNKDKCQGGASGESILELLGRCSFDTLLSVSWKIDRSLFRNTLEPILGPKSAIYGWHGVVGGQIDSLPTYEFYLPEGKPVVGLDYVCVMKGRSNKLLPEVVELLTDEESTNINILKTQYFSPYVNDTGKYSPKVKKLKEELLARMKN